MRLGYIILYVADVSATVLFYEKAFGLTLHFVHESNSYAEMQTGETKLAFVDEAMIKESHSFRINRTKDEAAGIEIAFVVLNVEEAFNRAIKAGAIAVVKPIKKPWGQIVSYVRDNNGCLVEICSPVES
ncbi:MAG: VOC family protein [Chlamydiae bacterium]|nr:VOC family protein [Chlamydiota bacterium]